MSFLQSRRSFEESASIMNSVKKTIMKLKGEHFISRHIIFISTCWLPENPMVFLNYPTSVVFSNQNNRIRIKQNLSNLKSME